MVGKKQIKTALISAFHKDEPEDLFKKLDAEGVKFLSTGGTQESVESLGYPYQKVENVTSYLSVLGDRVKTLYPKAFGRVLSHRDNEGDQAQVQRCEIPFIDLTIVDLYPLEQTVTSDASAEDIIEKTDIDGISLIHAGAENLKDVVTVSSKTECLVLLQILNTSGMHTDIEDRKTFAERTFDVSSHYGKVIHSWFATE